MITELYFDQKKYISVKDASRITGYTRDYIGQLSRSGKIDSKKVGDLWYVAESSILNYGTEKKDLEIKTSRHSEIFETSKNNDISASIAVKKIEELSQKSASKIQAHVGDILSSPKFPMMRGSLSLVYFTRHLMPLAFGLMLVFVGHTITQVDYPKLSKNISSAPHHFFESVDETIDLYSKLATPTYISLGNKIDNASSLFAQHSYKFFKNPSLYIRGATEELALKNKKVIDVGFSETQKIVASNYYSALAFISESLDGVSIANSLAKNEARRFGAQVSSSVEELNIFDKASVGIYNFISGLFGTDDSLEAETPSIQIPEKTYVSDEAKPIAVAPTKTIVSTNTPVVQNIVTNPVIERIIERVVPTTVTGVTREYLEQRLSETSNKFASELSIQLSSLSTGSNNAVTNIYQQIAHTGKIDNLVNTTIQNPSITTPTISGGTITNTSITATNLSATTFSVPTITFSGVAINSLLSIGSDGVVVATSTPTFGNFNATSTVATSTISTGGLAVGGSQFVVQQNSGRIGIGTTMPAATLDLVQSQNGLTLFASRRATDLAPSGDFITFKTANGATDLFRVDNSGNLYAGGIINSGSQTITSISTPQFRLQYDASNEATFSTTANGSTTVAVNGANSSLNFVPENDQINAFNFQNAAGTSVLNIDTLNGRLGLGVSNPTEKLEINGVLRVGTADDSGTINLGDIDTGSGNYTNGIFRGDLGSTVGGGYLNLGAWSGIAFNTSGAFLGSQETRMVINGSTGNVGIGTTTPWAKLSINPNGIAGPAFAVGSSTATNFIVTNGGNVGIGTTSPGYKLAVEGTVGIKNNLYINRTLETDDAKVRFFTGATSGWSVGYNNANNGFLVRNERLGFDNFTISDHSAGQQIAIGTNGTTRISIEGSAGNVVLNPTSGKVGVGTTTPWAKFSVDTTGLTDPAFAIGSTASTFLSVTSSGNVGIGTVNPTGLLTVKGTASILNSSDDTIFSFNPSSAVFTLGKGGVVAGKINFDGTPGEIRQDGLTQFDFPTNTIRVWSAFDTPPLGFGIGPDYAFKTEGTERLTIKGTTGNIGVGTTTPRSKLTVAGGGVGAESIILSKAFGSTISPGPVGFNSYLNLSGGLGTGGTEMLPISQRITSSGNLVNIGSIKAGEISLTSGGTFATKVDYTTGTSPLGVTTGDVNGDGKDDVVVVNRGSETVSVFINNGNGTFATKVDYAATGSVPTAVALGDMNGDGKLDMVVTLGGASGVAIYLNNGNGTFATRVNYGGGAYEENLSLADFNADGKLDVASASYFDTGVSVYMNNGNGTLATRVKYTTATGRPQGLAAADFNGDGYVDIATDDWTTATMAVMMNNGDGTFGADVEYAVPGEQYSVKAADLSGDGKADIVVMRSGGVSVFINNGNGTFAARVDYTNAGSVGIALGDVNGDGFVDIVSTNHGSDTVSVLINNGNGTFATKVDYATGDGPFYVALGDFDGNGKLDIVTTNNNTTTASVLLNVANPVFTTKSLTGFTGFGTTTPWAQLSINPNGITGPAFAIGSSTATNFVVTNGGRVGIGTTTPNNLISVYDLIDFSNTTFSTKLGYQAGKNNVSAATGNTFVGYQAGLYGGGSTSGASDNTAVGYRSLISNVSGGRNVSMGVNALAGNTSGGENVAIGYSSMVSANGAYNVAIGPSTLGVTTGNSNIAIGLFSLNTNIAGSDSIGIGQGSLGLNTQSTSNIAIGVSAAAGNGANYTNQGGIYMGTASGYSVQTGSDYNIFLGYRSGYSNTTGANNIIIGSNVDVPVVAGSRQLNIGNVLYATGIYNGSSMSSTPVSNGLIGIGTTTPAAKLHTLSTTEQLRLGYDASNYTSLTVSTNGNLTVAPTGGTIVNTVLPSTNITFTNPASGSLYNIGNISSSTITDPSYASGVTRIANSAVYTSINPTSSWSNTVFNQSLALSTVSGNSQNGGYMYGLYNTVKHAGTGTIGGAWTNYGEVLNTGGGTITDAVGTYGWVSNSAGGTITTGRAGDFTFINSGYNKDMDGVRARSLSLGFATTSMALNAISANIGTMGTSTVVKATFYQSSAGANLLTDVKHFEVADLSNLGTIAGNTYGLYIGDITNGTQSGSEYSIYASDNNTLNYFAGSVGIGTTTPGAKLDIANTNNWSSYTNQITSASVSGGVGAFKSVQTITDPDPVVASPYRSNWFETEINLTGNPSSSRLYRGVQTYISTPVGSTFGHSNLSLTGNHIGAYHQGTGQVNAIRALDSSAQLAGSATASLVSAGLFSASIAGTGTVTTLQGLDSGVVLNPTSTGSTVTSAIGVRSRATFASASTVTTLNLFEASVLSNSGTITNTYAYYAGDLTTGTQTNTPYSFYASDTGAYNYFAGNVGIGTTTPGAKLSVEVGGGAANARNTQLRFTHTSGTDSFNLATIREAATDDIAGLAFLDGSTELMTVLSTGNVTVGTPTVGAGQLQVKISEVANWAAFFHNDGNNSDARGVGIAAGQHANGGAGNLLYFYDGDGSELVGSVTYTGSATTYNTTSDVRAKSGIVDTHYKLSDLMAIKVRDYTMTSDLNNTPQTGFVAQELHDIYPTAVSVPANPDDMWAVDYGRITPLIVKSIQEMNLNLETIAGINTTNTTEADGFASAFWTGIKTKLVAWFSETTNGIGNMFANVFTANEKICVDDECLTKDDIRALLDLVQEQNNEPEEEETPESGDSIPPVITITGSANLQIPLNSNYSDLGATVTDLDDENNANNNLGIYFNVNGVDMLSVSISTNATTTHTIVYSAMDEGGNWSYATRTVEVIEETVEGPPEELPEEGGEGGE
ncbi:MAG: FG-GAP-like repeat-containing protein [Patescibacteria group bacterium]